MGKKKQIVEVELSFLKTLFSKDWRWKRRGAEMKVRRVLR
jgi:hypothetical protein